MTMSIWIKNGAGRITCGSLSSNPFHDSVNKNRGPSQPPVSNHNFFLAQTTFPSTYNGDNHLFLESLDLFDNGSQNLFRITGNTHVGEFENFGVGIFVDGDHIFGI